MSELRDDRATHTGSAGVGRGTSETPVEPGTVRIIPLRNMVLVRLHNGTKSLSPLLVIAPERAICRFYVVACGPEVRDVKPQQIVLASRLVGTMIGGELLIPESAVLGTV